MRWTVLLLQLLSSAANAQAMARYLGDRPGRATSSGGSSCQVLSRTFAWYGDSIAAGACSATTPTSKLQALLGSGWLGSTNAGDGGPPPVGAYTAAQIRARYLATRDTACGGERCGVYLFEGGVNSALNSVSAAATFADMVYAVDDARALVPKVGVVWSNIMPCRGLANCNASVWNTALAYNVLWSAACAARPDVKCLDVGAGSAFEDPGAPGYLPASFTCDGIHLLQAGTDAFAGLAGTAVQQLTANICP